MSTLEGEPEKREPGSGEPGTETKIPAARHTRGGSSYQHSLSARGIKSSGRARSCSDEDLLSSMERLERASRLTSFEDEDRAGRGGAYGRLRGGGTSTPHHRKEGARNPRFEG